MVERRIKKNVILAPYTTFKIGGPVKYFFQAKTEKDLISAIKWAKNKNLPYFILGGGSNVLVSNKGYEGLVIKIQNPKSKIQIKSKIQNPKIYVKAGVPLALAVLKATKNGLTGLEWAVGIPGTVGGAIYGNAGAFGGAMDDIVKSVKVLEIGRTKSQKSKVKNQNYADFIKHPRCRQSRAFSTKSEQSRDNSKFKIKKIRNQDCGFGYRESIFKHQKNFIILSAEIQLKKGDKEEIKKKMMGYLKKRAETQPQGPSAGCIFKNPEIANAREFEHKYHELNNKFVKICGKLVPIRENKISAGWLIEKCDLKGKRIGRVQISKKHANFIVNLGQTKAKDIFTLINLVKKRVKDKFGIKLKEEIEYVGKFKGYV